MYASCMPHVPPSPRFHFTPPQHPHTPTHKRYHFRHHRQVQLSNDKSNTTFTHTTPSVARKHPFRSGATTKSYSTIAGGEQVFLTFAYFPLLFLTFSYFSLLFLVLRLTFPCFPYFFLLFHTFAYFSYFSTSRLRCSILAP